MDRLRNHRDFVTVLKGRGKVSSRDIVVHYRMHPSPADTPAADPIDAHGEQTGDFHTRRLGLAVSKNVGHAVTRNTVKRRFRVLARRHENLLPPDVDIVMRAKPSAASASFASLDGQVETVFTAIARRVR